MHKQNRSIQVMLPSLASGLFVIGLSLLGLAIATFYYLSGNGTIYDFLFGPNSSAELIRQSKGTVEALSNTVFGNPVLNKILYFAFWMIVGLLVYFLLFVVIKGTSTAVADIEEATYKNASFSEKLQNIITKLTIRLILIIAWITYWIFFIKTLVPFSVLYTHVGINDFPRLNGWLYTTLGVLVIIASLHVHLIFMRLIALRVRLFGTEDGL